MKWEYIRTELRSQRRGGRGGGGERWASHIKVTEVIVGVKFVVRMG